MSVLRISCCIVNSFVLILSFNEIEAKVASKERPIDERLLETDKWRLQFGISEDYFYGEGALRNKYTLNCKGDEITLYACYKLCGHSSFRCSGGQCICVDGIINNFWPSKPQHQFKNSAPKTRVYQIDLVRKLAQHRSNNELLSEPLLDEMTKPALRHHIAHFCTNLEVARQCIRTCQKIGKPAFCGKDHRCYCGHRSGTGHDISKELDPNDMYTEFRDLYEKYFSKSTTPPPVKTTTEKETSEEETESSEDSDENKSDSESNEKTDEKSATQEDDSASTGEKSGGSTEAESEGSTKEKNGGSTEEKTGGSTEEKTGENTKEQEETNKEESGESKLAADDEGTKEEENKNESKNDNVY